jgi:hypothetical protein
MSDHGDGIKILVFHEACRYPVKLFASAARPDFSPKQSKAHLNEPVIEVCENYVIAAIGQGMIKHNWANLAGMRMGQSDVTLAPASRHGRQAVSFDGLAVVPGHRDFGERRLICQPQTDLDGPADVFRRKP